MFYIFVSIDDLPPESPLWKYVRFISYLILRNSKVYKSLHMYLQLAAPGSPPAQNYKPTMTRILCKEINICYKFIKLHDL